MKLNRQFKIGGAAGASALGLLALQTPAATAGVSSEECASAGSVTVVSDEVTRVFRKRSRLYACAYRKGHVISLGLDETRGCGSDGCAGVNRLAVSGRYVAYASYASTESTSSVAVLVVDTLRRKRRLKWDSSTDADQDSTSVIVSSLVVSPKGNPAWTAASTATGVPGVRYSVQLHDGRTHSVIDPGPNVEGASLSLGRNGRLFWINGDQARTALLP